MQAARAEYDRAKTAFERATDLAYEMGVDNPDGAHVLHTAAIEYNRAVQKYSAAVKRFTDFILRANRATLSQRR
jgi:hypothetical protein